ncbi:CPBP family intramembrane glutamic endopeptidase [Caldalkalibacillus salinus]|uniref:CPBP family intramembrane glutamic endopeptidase n=1 Tax=Caldalkalibacillus salinus TaxID=2803787 RepID=UPI001920D885|nr:type II CAAX endopeptidase family protein [Caldalkalibacillus salinus]
MNNDLEPNQVSEQDQSSNQRPKLSFGYPLFVSFIVAFFIGSFVLTFSLLIYSEYAGIEFDSLISYPYLLGDALMVAILLLFFKNIRRFVLDSIRLSALKQGRTYAYMAAGALIVMVAQYVFIEWLNVDDPSNQSQMIGLDNVSGLVQYTLFFLAVAFFTPLKEEILFRGVLHRFFEMRHHWVMGLIISAIVFGVLHTDYPFTATTMGVVFVLLYRLTQSLSAPILLHMIWNAVGVIILTLE